MFNISKVNNIKTVNYKNVHQNPYRNITKNISTDEINKANTVAAQSVEKGKIKDAHQGLIPPVNVSHKKVLIISGATGQMGPGFIEEGVKRGYNVRACTRNPNKYVETPYVKYVASPEERLGEKEYWKAFFQEHGEGFDEVVYLNLLGAAVAPKGKTLEEINLKPVVSAMDALADYKYQKGKRCSFQHVSSIAATILGDTHSYSRVRKLADETLLHKAEAQDISYTAFRPGLIFNELRENCMIHMGHPYSPEQLAALPLQMILGSGKQIQQPVFQGDLVAALMNAAELDQKSIINAVGSEVITQKEMFRFFASLGGKKFRPLHLSIEVIKAIAEHCPKGRFAPYAIEMFDALESPEHNKPLCKEDFQKLLGRETLSMRDVYYVEGDERIVLARPPILEHAKEIASKLVSCPIARKEIIGVVWNRKFDLIVGIIKPSHYESRPEKI